MNDLNSNESRKFRYLEVISGLFVAVLLLSNITSTKLVSFGSMTFDGGTLLFPLSYIFGDILTEVYGYNASRRVIWTGFLACLLMSVTFMIVGRLPSDPAWTLQKSYEDILYSTPRIAAASILAYLCGEFSNSFVLAKLKIWTSGKYLWTRTIGSTVVGEFVDTVLFVLIAFYGTYASDTLVKIAWFNYFFKCGVEVVLTPATYWIVGFLKRNEEVDHYDRGTRFNPFRCAE